MTSAAAMRMEWTKLRTVPSTAWSIVGLIGLTVATGSLLMWSLGTTHCASHCDQDMPQLSLSGVYLAQLAVVVLAALAITSEYDTMMIRTTLAARPRRLTVLGAKAAIVTATVLVTGGIAVLATFVVARGIPVDGYLPLSLDDGATRRAYFGTVAYLGLIALFSVGVGTLVRHTAGAITTMMALLYVAPIIAQLVSDERWRHRIERYAPMSSGLTIQATTHLDRLPIGPWHGLGVLAAYAAAALLLGAIAFLVRDA